MRLLISAGFALSILVSPFSYARGVIGGGSTGGGLSRSAPDQSVRRSPVRKGRPYSSVADIRTQCRENTIQYALKFGENGNPFAKDLICKRGKWVPLD